MVFCAAVLTREVLSEAVMIGSRGDQKWTPQVALKLPLEIIPSAKGQAEKRRSMQKSD
jgi:hypothetical protein